MAENDSSRQDITTYADFVRAIKEGRTNDIIKLLEACGFCDPAERNAAEWSWVALELLRQLLVCVAGGLGSEMDLPGILLSRAARSIELSSFAAQLLVMMDGRCDGSLNPDEKFLAALSAGGQLQDNVIQEIDGLDACGIIGLLEHISQHYPEFRVNDGYNAAILQKALKCCLIDESSFFFVLACSLVVPAEVAENARAKSLLALITNVPDAGLANLAMFLVSARTAEDALRKMLAAKLASDVAGGCTDGDNEGLGEEGGGVCTGECGACSQDCPSHDVGD